MNISSEDLLKASTLILLCVVPFFLVIRASRPRLPPGPSFFAQFNPKTAQGRLFRDVHTFTSVLQELSGSYGKIFSVWLGPNRTVVSSHPADVAQIYVQTKDFPRPPCFTEALRVFSPYGLNQMSRLQHERAKKVLRENFNVSSLSKSKTPVAQTLRDMCSGLHRAAGAPGSAPEPVDITETVSLALFHLLVHVAFGTNMDADKRKRFSDNVETLFEQILIEIVQFPVRQFLVPFGARKKFHGARNELWATIEEFIDARKRQNAVDEGKNSGDLVDACLKVNDEDMSVVMSIILEFAFAGAHTSSHMLVWAIFELCINPDVVQRFQMEIDKVVGERPMDEYVTLEDLERLPYAKAIWKEAARVHPPNPGTSRITSRNVKLAGSGTLVPKGTQIIGFNGAAQMSPEIWQNPTEFKPERWGMNGKAAEGDRIPPGSYVPFGIGGLSCPGRFLADFEGPLVLAELFRRFDFELACEKDKVITHSFFVDSARVLDSKGGVSEGGLPVRVFSR